MIRNAIVDFAHIAARAGLAVDLAQREHLADGAFLESVFGEPVLAAIRAAGYPGGAEIPTPAEALFVYPLDEIAGRQAGYRTDAQTGEVARGWDADHWVFADLAADPFTVGPGGAVFHARHGAGRWDHAHFAPDLFGFYDLLRIWIEFFAIEHGGVIVDDDFTVVPARRAELIARIGSSRLPVNPGAVAGVLLGD